MVRKRKDTSERNDKESGVAQGNRRGTLFVVLCFKLGNRRILGSKTG